MSELNTYFKLVQNLNDMVVAAYVQGVNDGHPLAHVYAADWRLIQNDRDRARQALEAEGVRLIEYVVELEKVNANLANEIRKERERFAL